jgi:hypothetical protein
LRWQDDRITAADTLIGIEADTDYPSEALEAALAHFFSEGADNYDMIKGILGPYLAIAGYYYRRSLESEDLPSVSAREFRNEIRSQYSGQESASKAFKTSRYLLQLEEVGILQSESNQTGRNWTGIDEVFQDLLQQREQLEPIAEIIA